MKKTFLLLVIIATQSLLPQWEKCQMIYHINNPRIYSIISSNNFLYAVGDACFWISSDDGYSWQVSNEGLSSRDCPAYSIAEFNGNIFIGGLSYLLKSVDNGKNWIKTNHNNRVQAIVNKDSILIISDNQGILYSTDQGESWNKSNYSQPFCYKLYVYNDFIFAGSEKGLMVSNDCGKTWEIINEDLAGLSAIEFKNKLMLIGTFNGFFVSYDFGRTTEKKDLGVQAEIVRAITAYDNFIIISAYSKADSMTTILISSDDGNTWSEKIIGIERVKNTDIYDFHIFNDWIFAANSHIGIYKTNLSYITSIEELSWISDNLYISHSPAGEYIEIYGLNKGLQPLVPEQNIKIFNLLGECVLSVAQTFPSVDSGQTGMSDLLRIDVSGLPAGVYFVRVGDWVGRFVKV